jgi:hypothetical protein
MKSYLILLLLIGCCYEKHENPVPDCWFTIVSINDAISLQESYIGNWERVLKHRQGTMEEKIVKTITSRIEKANKELIELKTKKKELKDECYKEVSIK